MKRIKISGKHELWILVDDRDYRRLSKFKWHLRTDGYPVRSIYLGKDESGKYRSTTKPMHQDILKLPKGMTVDHRDRDRLNMRRANLRPCTQQQNVCNNGPRKDKLKSKFKGVTRHTQYGAWTARVQSNGKRVSLGFFDTDIAAAKAYDRAARKLHGEFAYLNFP